MYLFPSAYHWDEEGYPLPADAHLSDVLLPRPYERRRPPILFSSSEGLHPPPIETIRAVEILKAILRESRVKDEEEPKPRAAPGGETWRKVSRKSTHLMSPCRRGQWLVS